MSSLAELPELAGFFSYSREDDEAFKGTLSALRDGIQRELSAQLGRSKRTFRLWQDQVAIAPGKLWELEIKAAIDASFFFIPIVTPRAVSSKYCKFEFEAFLAREKAIGRSDLVFPILYISVAALENEAKWRDDPVLSTIGRRQYVDWRPLRHLDAHTTAVREQIERLCQKIVEALNAPWTSPEERQRMEEAKARQQAEEEARRLEAEAQRKAEEEQHRKQVETEARRRAEEERRRQKAEAKRRADEDERRKRVKAEARPGAEDEAEAKANERHKGWPISSVFLKDWQNKPSTRVVVAVAVLAVLLLIGVGGYAFVQHTYTTVEKTVQQREAIKAEQERQAAAEAKRKEDEAERQRLAKAEQERQAKAEQERQARVVADVEAKRERSAVSNQTATLTPGYPSKPVVMIIPFLAGGGSDVLGRILAQRMSEILGQPMVVENVPGGGGANGSKRAADAAPDGYQLIFGNIATHALYQALFKTPLYNAATDFTPVALVADIPMVLVTRPSLGTNDLKEFVAYAKANQSTMQYGSGGVGTTSHLACEMLNRRLGIRTKHVQYRGMAPALVDLLANHVDYMCDSVSTAKVWSGRAKPIAIMAKDRSKLLPSVPTAREQGLSDLEVSNWNAIFLPKGVPADIVSKLHDAAIQAMKTPAVRERFEAMGAEIVAEDRSTPGYLGQFVKGEISKWTATIMASGVTVQ